MRYCGLAENQFKLSSFLWSPGFLVSLRSENCQEFCQPKASFWYFPKAVQSYNKKPEWERVFFFFIYHARACSCISWKRVFKEKCSCLSSIFFKCSNSSVLCSINCFIHFTSQVLRIILTLICFKWHHVPHPCVGYLAKPCVTLTSVKSVYVIYLCSDWQVVGHQQVGQPLLNGWAPGKGQENAKGTLAQIEVPHWSKLCKHQHRERERKREQGRVSIMDSKQMVAHCS